MAEVAAFLKNEIEALLAEFSGNVRAQATLLYARHRAQLKLKYRASALADNLAQLKALFEAHADDQVVAKFYVLAHIHLPRDDRTFDFKQSWLKLKEGARVNQEVLVTKHGYAKLSHKILLTQVKHYGDFYSHAEQEAHLKQADAEVGATGFRAPEVKAAWANHFSKRGEHEKAVAAMKESFDVAAQVYGGVKENHPKMAHLHAINHEVQIRKKNYDDAKAAAEQMAQVYERSYGAAKDGYRYSKLYLKQAQTYAAQEAKDKKAQAKHYIKEYEAAQERQHAKLESQKEAQKESCLLIAAKMNAMQEYVRAEAHGRAQAAYNKSVSLMGQSGVDDGEMRLFVEVLAVQSESQSEGHVEGGAEAEAEAGAEGGAGGHAEGHKSYSQDPAAWSASLRQRADKVAELAQKVDQRFGYACRASLRAKSEQAAANLREGGNPQTALDVSKTTIAQAKEYYEGQESNEIFLAPYVYASQAALVLGDFGGAKAYLESAQKVFVESSGTVKAHTVDIGKVHLEKGFAASHAADVQAYFEAQASLAKKVYGENSTKFGGFLQAQGDAFVAMGKGAEAVAFYEHSISTIKGAKGSEDSQASLSAYERLNNYYLSAGNYAEAQAVIPRMIAIHKSVYGEGEVGAKADGRASVYADLLAEAQTKLGGALDAGAKAATEAAAHIGVGGGAKVEANANVKMGF